jgi:predicted transcriptional regulator
MSQCPVVQSAIIVGSIALQVVVLRMIFSENRDTLFRIMR